MTTESNVSIFEEITQNCSQKNIQSHSKKLIKKISFKSSKDIETLRDLTFLLYIYDYIDYVEKIIKMTYDNIQNINPTDGWVWADVHLIWGLEIRLLRKKSETEKINQIISEIDKRLKRPPRTEAKEMARRERFVIWETKETGYIDVTRCEILNGWVETGKTSNANAVRLLAISQLIGLTETGLYPVLNDNKEKIETIINEYKNAIIKTSK